MPSKKQLTRAMAELEDQLHAERTIAEDGDRRLRETRELLKAAQLKLDTEREHRTKILWDAGLIEVETLRQHMSVETEIVWGDNHTTMDMMKVTLLPRTPHGKDVWFARLRDHITAWELKYRGQF